MKLERHAISRESILHLYTKIKIQNNVKSNLAKYKG